MISTIASDLPAIINTSLGIVQSDYKYLFIIKHINKWWEKKKSHGDKSFRVTSVGIIIIDY